MRGRNKVIFVQMTSLIVCNLSAFSETHFSGNFVASFGFFKLRYFLILGYMNTISKVFTTRNVTLHILANALTPAVQALFARVVGSLLNEPSLAVRSFWNWDNTNSHPSGLWFTEPREDLWRCRRDPCVVFRTVSMSTSIGEKSKRPRSDRSEKLDERCSTRY